MKTIVDPASHSPQLCVRLSLHIVLNNCNVVLQLADAFNGTQRFV